MPKLFNRLRRGGRGATVAALSLLALAGGVITVAPAASASTQCQWQPLYLQNGWHSEQSVYNTGDPAYCIDHGIVYLSGSLAQSPSGVNYFARLPQQARPASNMYLSVYTYAGTSGTVQVNTDGTMYAYGGAAASFTSLASISFPVASAAVQPITPGYGWQSAQGQWGTGDPSYYVSNGAVHLSGSVFNPAGTLSPAAIATVPSAALPAYNQEMSVYSYGGAVALAGVDVFGMLSVSDASEPIGNSERFTSLAGITYPAAAAAEMPLPLLDGWQSGQNTWSGNGLSYYVNNGVVYLDGAVLNSGHGKVAVLPPGARPTHTLYVTVNISGWYVGAGATVRIEPDGSIYTYGGPQGTYTSGDYTPFSGISFEAGE